MKQVAIVLLLLLSASAYSQKIVSKNELSLKGFRNSSTGLEYRYKQVSVHSEYYLTVFKSGVTTKFFKAVASAWLLSIGKKQNPS